MLIKKRNKYLLIIIIFLLLLISILLKSEQEPEILEKYAIGNANFYNEKDRKYYSDAKFTVEANDNTEYLMNLFSNINEVHIPKGNFLCKSQIRIKGENIKVFGVKGESKIVFDSDLYNSVEKGAVSAYIINDSYSRSFDHSTAQNITIDGIIFELKQKDDNFYNFILMFANVKGGNIQNCSFISDFSSENFVTLLDLYSCCKNLKINNCTFKNMTGSSKGSCIWVRNLTMSEESAENVTENISISKCTFTQNSADEILAVYSSIGDVKKVDVRDSIFNDFSDINVKIFATYSSENKYYGTVEDVIFDNNKIISEFMNNFTITVGGPNRKNLVSNIVISNNDIKIEDDTDNKGIIIYINDIETNVQNITVINNTIKVNKLLNSTGIYNANLAKSNSIIGELKRGIVYGESYENIIDGSLQGIVSPEIAQDNKLYNCKIGISCGSKISLIRNNEIVLKLNGLCGIDVQKDDNNEEFEITCIGNKITTIHKDQYSFVIHNGNIRLISNSVFGSGGKIYINDQANIIIE
ncbi:MAG: hypothetical protein H7Y18_20095 [Clostridiaceae bacterium]|nr:hypothetical protein [Clostridiaceae bacterium]